MSKSAERLRNVLKEMRGVRYEGVPVEDARESVRRVAERAVVISGCVQLLAKMIEDDPERERFTPELLNQLGAGLEELVERGDSAAEGMSEILARDYNIPDV